MIYASLTRTRRHGTRTIIVPPQSISFLPLAGPSWLKDEAGNAGLCASKNPLVVKKLGLSERVTSTLRIRTSPSWRRLKRCVMFQFHDVIRRPILSLTSSGIGSPVAYYQVVVIWDGAASGSTVPNDDDELFSVRKPSHFIRVCPRRRQDEANVWAIMRPMSEPFSESSFGLLLEVGPAVEDQE